MVDLHVRCDFDSILAALLKNFNLALVVCRSNHCGVNLAAWKSVGFSPPAARFESVGASPRCSCEFALLGGEIKQAADPGKEAEEGAEGRNASANNEAAHFDSRPI